MEGNFAEAANEHGFKRSRRRRLWRQKIQDYLIATVQNVRLLMEHPKKRNWGAGVVNLVVLREGLVDVFWLKLVPEVGFRCVQISREALGKL